jgi:hypothetical protein
MWIPSSVEVLCNGCFRQCSSLSTLRFESDSRLARIESQAFSGCVRLQSLRIPQLIQRLERNWFGGSSFDSVVFESAASLLTMIETGEIDLRFKFDLDVCPCDGVMKFPGYLVSIIPGVDDLVRLVKLEDVCET